MSQSSTYSLTENAFRGELRDLRCTASGFSLPWQFADRSIGGSFRGGSLVRFAGLYVADEAATHKALDFFHRQLETQAPDSGGRVPLLAAAARVLSDSSAESSAFVPEVCGESAKVSAAT